MEILRKLLTFFILFPSWSASTCIGNRLVNLKSQQFFLFWKVWFSYGFIKINYRHSKTCFLAKGSYSWCSILVVCFELFISWHYCCWHALGWARHGRKKGLEARFCWNLIWKTTCTITLGLLEPKIQKMLFL